jgi:hypothetical protein
MRGPQVKTPLTVRLDPSADDAPAGKTNGVGAHRIDNCQFQIAVEWRARNFVPHHFFQ